MEGFYMAISRLAGVVLALALSSALISLFGPQARVFGLDLGSLCTTVFGFTLWVGAGLVAVYPDRIFPPAWSIAERRAWAGVFFATLIFLAYLRFMLALAGLPEVPDRIDELPAAHFVGNLVVLLIGWAVVSATVRGRGADIIECDERDLRLRRAADSVGDWALTVVIVWCVGLLALQPAQWLQWWLAPLIAANVLIGILIAKSLVEHAYLVGRYAWDRR
jgi:hypothetical protein